MTKQPAAPDDFVFVTDEVKTVIPENYGDADEWYQQGKVSESQGTIQLAESDYRKAISIDPIHLGAVYKLAMILYSRSHFNESIELLKKVIELYPEIARLHNALGLAYKKTNHFYKARACFSRALSYQPGMTEAYNNMGLVLEEMGKYDSALKCFIQATVIKEDYAVAYYNTGRLLFEMGEVDQAVQAYTKAIRSKNNFSEAHNNLGIALQYQGDHQRALACFEDAARFNQNNASSLYNLAILFQHNRDLKKAQACIEKTLSLDPDDTKILIPYYQLLRDVCAWKQAESISIRIDTSTRNALKAGLRPNEMPFLNLVRSQDMAENMVVAKSWSNEIINNTGNRKPLTDRKKHIHSGKITIGYLSDGFRNHPNTHLICDLFKCYDRKRFKIRCYSYGENDQNPYRKRIEQGCDHFRDLQGNNDYTIARKIYEDRCDILVELKGFTFGSRLKICAYRPAPVQVRYLGLTGTTGSPFFDYLITDRIVTPPQFTSFYSEKFAYLPGCFQVNSIPHRDGMLSISRRDAGLPQRGFVFCSFCASYKIDAETFGVWMKILHRTPGSYLWLLEDTEEFIANIINAARVHGIGSERLIFADRCGREKHLARLSCADLALDTIYVNGMATTSELLWAGTPVVAVKGRSFIGRVSASILKAVGLEEMICSSLQAYEDTAVYFANNPDHFRVVQARIARNRLLKTLYDTKSFVQRLERLYEKMWEIYQEGDTPRLIDVDWWK